MEGYVTKVHLRDAIRYRAGIRLRQVEKENLKTRKIYIWTKDQKQERADQTEKRKRGKGWDGMGWDGLRDLF
jgi:hypothetical protein